VKIKWIGQSGYLLSDGKKTICIDPYLSDVVNRVAKRPRMREIPIKPEKLKADIVVCTHNHLDHVDIDAIALMNKSITFLAPTDCEQTLKDLGVIKYTPFDEDQVFMTGDFKITAVFAEHTVPAIGVLVEYNGESLYFSGDTIYNKKLENIKCDYMFVCINGKFGNMNVNDAILLTNKIKPKMAVPNHYDMFESNSENPENYTKFVSNGFLMEFNKEYEVSNGCLI
jgi:L-ascorbate 6-phosphate lactonase